MPTSNEILWRAWGQKIIEIIGAMNPRFEVKLDGHLRFFHDTPEGELLVVMTPPRSDEMIFVDLYGEYSRPTPVASISLIGEEVRVGGHGSFHRFEAREVPEIADFAKGMRAKALASMEPRTSPPASAA